MTSSLMGHESYDLENFGMSGSKEFLKFVVIDELSNYTKVRSATPALMSIARKVTSAASTTTTATATTSRWPTARWLQPLP